METEAYLGRDDPASHAYRGRRYPGNASIYRPPGCWYVYRAYGVHWCANLVTGPEGHGAAVLLRAVEVTSGMAAVRRRRGLVPHRRLTDGPGKLAAALAIDRDLDGQCMSVAEAWVEPGRTGMTVRTAPRIGITKAADWPLRFLAAGRNETGAPPDGGAPEGGSKRADQ